jgi:hypothetical protein
MKMWPTSVEELINDKHFFVYSQTCLAGAFDSNDCFAEHLTVKSDHAAVAAIMNSRYGWGEVDSTDGASQRFDRQFWDAIYNESIYTYGEANQDSKSDNINMINAYEGSIRWCYYTINLFGDPSLAIRSTGLTRNPFNPSPGDGDIGVNVNPVLSVGISGPAYNPMTVTFYDDSDDSVIGVARNVQSGDRASVTWKSLGHNAFYNWYVVADDGEFNVTSNKWIFKTEQYLYINVDIDIFNRKKVSIEVFNTGYISLLDVNWMVYIKGGFFGMVDFSCSGVIDSLEGDSVVTISSDNSGFGIGRVDVTVEVYIDYMVCSKVFSGFMLGRLLIVFP